MKLIPLIVLLMLCGCQTPMAITRGDLKGVIPPPGQKLVVELSFEKNSKVVPLPVEQFDPALLIERLERKVRLIQGGKGGGGGIPLFVRVSVQPARKPLLELPGTNTGLVNIAMGDKGKKELDAQDLNIARLGYLPEDLTCTVVLGFASKQVVREFPRGEVMRFMEPIPGNGDPTKVQIQQEYSRGVGRRIIVWLQELELLP